MPELDSVAGNARLLRGLIWAGVSLAPVAAAVVLLGTASNSVRFAVILIAVAVVLIGASVLVRNDPVVSRLEIEDRVAEEIAQLRRELRAEFGPGAAMPHPVPAPAQRPLPPQRGTMAPPPAAEESGFFADAPPLYPEDDPFPGPSDDFAMQPSGPPPMHQPGPAPMQPGLAPMQQPGPPMGAARPPAPGGRAGVPAAAAAVRPPARTGPGMTTGGRPIGNPGQHEPGSVTGGRAASAAVPPPPQQLPRQRGAASVQPLSPQGPQRASASVRPGPAPGGAYGPAESLSDDFGASNGYAAQAPGVYGAPAGGGNTYGAPNTHGPGASDDYSFDSDEYNGYGAPSYGQDQGDYGYAENGYADADGYAEPDGYGHDAGRETGDPSYKARRHRPSANDTNVGSLSDFASYGGYAPEEPDDRYVQGYAPPRGRH